MSELWGWAAGAREYKKDQMDDALKQVQALASLAQIKEANSMSAQREVAAAMTLEDIEWGKKAVAVMQENRQKLDAKPSEASNPFMEMADIMKAQGAPPRVYMKAYTEAVDMATKTAELSEKSAKADAAKIDVQEKRNTMIGNIAAAAMQSPQALAQIALDPQAKGLLPPEVFTMPFKDAYWVMQTIVDEAQGSKQRTEERRLQASATLENANKVQNTALAKVNTEKAKVELDKAKLDYDTMKKMEGEGTSNVLDALLAKKDEEKKLKRAKELEGVVTRSSGILMGLSGWFERGPAGNVFVDNTENMESQATMKNIENTAFQVLRSSVRYRTSKLSDEKIEEITKLHGAFMSDTGSISQITALRDEIANTLEDTKIELDRSGLTKGDKAKLVKEGLDQQSLIDTLDALLANPKEQSPLLPEGVKFLGNMK